MDTWDMISAERASLADALDGLSAAEWAKPSLCADWSVREVVGHMIATASMTPPIFFGAMVASGFRFNVMTQGNVRRITEGKTDGEIAAAFRAKIDARTAPPGPTVSWLGETIVHGEDVFRVLGDYRKHPIEHVVAVADFYRNSNLLIGAKRRIEGVTLVATDTDWRCGEGPELTGPLIALVMAMTGRVAALDDLSGPGVGVLRDRS